MGNTTFLELQGIADKLVLALQTLGGVVLLVVIVLIALTTMTSFGNEHRLALSRLAALGAIIGIATLMYAHPITSMFLRIFPIAP